MEDAEDLAVGFVQYRTGTMGDSAAGYSASSYKQSSESFAPTVGYRAVISVFQAATGKLLMRSPVRNQQAADHGKTSNPYVRSQMIELLDSLEPSAKDSR